jgi:hypothetical protein
MSLEAIASQEDIEKLKSLQEVPTDIDALEKQIRVGGEGKTAFDSIAMFMGGDDPEIEGMLMRTNFQSFEETFITSQVLYLAKYGFRRAWMKGGPPDPTDGWEMPEIKQLVLWMIHARPSINSESSNRAKEAIQGLKVTLNANRNPLGGP